jgi:hypothetical protein
VRASYFGPLGEPPFRPNRGTDYNTGTAGRAAYYREANEQILVCATHSMVRGINLYDA